MMAQFNQLPLINHGELNDDQKTNAVITAVNNLLEGDNLDFSDCSSDGIQYLNGFEADPDNGPTGYSVLTIDGKKFVIFAINVKPSDTSINYNHKDIFMVPSSIAPASRATAVSPGVLSGSVLDMFVSLDPDGTCTVGLLNDQTVDGDGGYHCTLVYLAK